MLREEDEKDQKFKKIFQQASARGDGKIKLSQYVSAR